MLELETSRELRGKEVRVLACVVRCMCVHKYVAHVYVCVCAYMYVYVEEVCVLAGFVTACVYI